MSEDRRAVYFYTGRKLTNASFLVTSTAYIVRRLLLVTQQLRCYFHEEVHCYSTK